MNKHTHRYKVYTYMYKRPALACLDALAARGTPRVLGHAGPSLPSLSLFSSPSSPFPPALLLLRLLGEQQQDAPQNRRGRRWVRSSGKHQREHARDTRIVGKLTDSGGLVDALFQVGKVLHLRRRAVRGHQMCEAARRCTRSWSRAQSDGLVCEHAHVHANSWRDSAWACL